jgi:glutamate racemase
MNEFVDKKKKIGLYDSGIGGFSILSQLFKLYPSGEYYYYSDDLYAPYGPLSDEVITERSIVIVNELLSVNVDIIVVACNTATAASIDQLRAKFKDVPIVGVEPYLNAYQKIVDDFKKVAVITTESTGRSERFIRLKDRLDPQGNIHHIALKYMAKIIEDFYYSRIEVSDFFKAVRLELAPLANKKFTHLILGCTHYPLIKNLIENETGSKTLSPCEYVAMRVLDLLNLKPNANKNTDESYSFYSSRNPIWMKKKRLDLLLPFKLGDEHVKNFEN